MKQKTIRIYGIAGEDKYSMIGNSQTIKIVIIGGRDKDSIIQQGQSRIHIYDDRNNSFQTDRARLHLLLIARFMLSTILITITIKRI